jgi:hypothetical protein
LPTKAGVVIKNNAGTVDTGGHAHGQIITRPDAEADEASHQNAAPTSNAPTETGC